MQRRNTGWLLLVAALALAGCGNGQNARTGTVRSTQQVAPTYDVRDSRQARKGMQFRELLRIAVDRLRHGELDEAERHARSALKIESGIPDAYTVLAAIAGQRGEAEKAGQLYRQAAEMAPGQGDVLNNYGAWLCANGYPAEALVWFDRALADGGYGARASALANAGGCALDAGQRERATRDLRQALELDPANAYALESMARGEYAAGRYFEARAFSQRRLAAAPATVSVLQLAVQIEDRLGDKAAASRYQRRLREEFPQDATLNPQG
ncbi:type IV pilus biogenesis/stability protein PilW [Flavobacterium sp. MXW15]|uniref:Type IV pilus biogenesis/stability protein PilW n=1 Tax=Xanthomonas chitinilytica TaxID=2989819 RepID=A0ABT3JX93_9XANT|nr:type IV pilus biogenesis/stability protein PilW [Xanthomonas sp. H13-6]MCW4455059.1 type IV pilus biogenesis/stability protein PilW [Flavobacterium sp. MXW15]MCW4472775.1 type IV pilus biogenesis/stability protein PilW [Xanthomonas sp. H13-6]